MLHGPTSNRDHAPRGSSRSSARYRIPVSERRRQCFRQACRGRSFTQASGTSRSTWQCISFKPDRWPCDANCKSIWSYDEQFVRPTIPYSANLVQPWVLLVKPVKAFLLFAMAPNPFDSDPTSNSAQMYSSCLGSKPSSVCFSVLFEIATSLSCSSLSPSTVRTFKSYHTRIMTSFFGVVDLATQEREIVFNTVKFDIPSAKPVLTSTPPSTLQTRARLQASASGSCTEANSSSKTFPSRGDFLQSSYTSSWYPLSSLPILNISLLVDLEMLHSPFPVVIAHHSRQTLAKLNPPRSFLLCHFRSEKLLRWLRTFNSRSAYSAEASLRSSHGHE